jgi:5-hydroxyisourate hydrolase-like protein (transthyretin family)
VPEGLQAEEVRIGVYDLLGRQVATVADGRREAGRHEQQMDLSGMPSGTYFLRLRVGDEVQSQKLTVLR